MSAAVAMLWAAAAWSLFAFGGAYSWTTVPLIALSLVLGATVRPAVAAARTRALDVALLACLAAAVIQLLPLPPSIRLGLSPALAAVDRTLRLDADQTASAPAPINLDIAAGVESTAIAAAIVIIFWCARAVFERGGVRRTTRAIAVCGLIAGTIAIAQHATAPHLLYWIWHPQSGSGRYPFGPFVNRNDLAAWLVMAIPLTAGSMANRIEMQRRDGRLRVETALDSTGVWLAGALCVMAAALVTTLSRSGLTAAVCAAAAFLCMSRNRLHGRGRAGLIIGCSIVVLVAAGYVNVGALTARVGETMASGGGGRREIWLTTAGIVADFWRTGVGVGAFERAMSIYQPPHVFAFNHAHDEYLQIAAEGGLLLGIPVLVAIAAGLWQIAARLRADRTPMFWNRAGAASAVIAIAIQSVWETGLRMPANAVLFALCVAIAVHRPAASSASSVSPPTA